MKDQIKSKHKRPNAYFNHFSYFSRKKISIYMEQKISRNISKKLLKIKNVAQKE